MTVICKRANFFLTFINETYFFAIRIIIVSVLKPNVFRCDYAFHIFQVNFMTAQMLANSGTITGRFHAVHSVHRLNLVLAINSRQKC